MSPPAQAGTAEEFTPPGSLPDPRADGLSTPWSDGERPISPSAFRAAIRLTGYLSLIAALAPFQAIMVAVSPRAAGWIPRFFHRLVARMIGFRIRVVGENAGALRTAQPTLFLANHVSYFDITVLGALIDGSFVAKSEVAGWPLFGMLAKLQRTVFVVRRRGQAGAQRDAVAERLGRGESLIVFPEGTSGDGTRALPFKSSLLAAANPLSDGSVPSVQPVSIAYTRMNGVPLGKALRPFFAWYGDMDLAPHLWRALSLGCIEVVVEFHEPVRIDQFNDRKALAAHCRERVSDGLSRALSGRSDALAASPGGGEERFRNW